MEAEQQEEVAPLVNDANEISDENLKLCLNYASVQLAVPRMVPPEPEDQYDYDDYEDEENGEAREEEAEKAEEGDAAPPPGPQPSHHIPYWSFGAATVAQPVPPKLQTCLDTVSSTIRQKPNWWTKIHDPTIVAKWEDEIAPQITDKLPKGTDSSAALRVVLEELKWMVSRGNREVGAVPAAVNGTWQADGVVSERLRLGILELLEAASRSRECGPDMHPNSADQVLNFFHPSLHCLYYGKSRALLPASPRKAGIGFDTSPDLDIPTIDLLTCGAFANHPSAATVTKDAATRGWGRQTESSKYQWLPAEYAVSMEGKVEIQSYISDLDPVEHRRLYVGLAKVFEKMVPLLELTLRDLDLKEVEYHGPPSRYHHRKRSRSGAHQSDERDPFSWYKSTKMEVRDERVMRVINRSQAGSIIVKVHDKFEPPKDEPPALSLRGMRLQVITKAAKIVLKPGDRYAGGNWHMEGMDNEAIIATGIFYADQENITDSQLEFRKALDPPDLPGRTDSNGGRDNLDLELLRMVYPTGQNIQYRCGAVPTLQGRCLVFPNTMQHCVSPFGLKDTTKPGWRTVIVFFVVNPRERIPSSLHVVPTDIGVQRRAFVRLLRHLFRGNSDVAGEVSDFLANGLSDEEAKAERLDLMAERSTGGSRGHYGNPYEANIEAFSMCEH